MFKQVLLFSQGVAEALYDDKMITTLDVLQDLTDDIIKELCHDGRRVTVATMVGVCFSYLAFA
jgi:hypothetical protein